MVYVPSNAELEDPKPPPTSLENASTHAPPAGPPDARVTVPEIEPPSTRAKFTLLTVAPTVTLIPDRVWATSFEDKLLQLGSTWIV